MLEVDMHFSHMIDSEIVAKSIILNAQSIVFVTIICQRLLAGMREINELNNQIININQILANKNRDNEMLKPENEELKRLIDRYACIFNHK